MLPQIGTFFRHLPVLLKHNSPVVLTGVAVAGTITTAVLTARAAFRVGKDVNAGHYEPLMEGMPPETYNAKSLVKHYWKDFIPPVVVGGATIACVIGANRAGARQAAALATAYTLSEKAFEEYKGKVVEQIGANKERKVVDAVAQDRVERASSGSKEIILAEDGEVPCMEALSGRFFSTTYESIRKAQNDFNERLLHDGYGSLNQFWDYLGLPHTEMGEELGWTSDHLVEVHITTTTMGEGRKPCLDLGYERNPEANFWTFQ